MEKGKEILYLSKTDVEKVGLSMKDVIGYLEEAFTEKGKGNFEMPPKPGLHTKGDAFIHAMPCYIPKMKAAGIKWVSGYPENLSKYNLPYITGLLILNCPETGVPLAVMDCVWITAMRTGAASGLSAKYLAKEDSKVAGIIGTGVQARTQLEALNEVCPNLTDVLCYDIVPRQMELFVEEMQPKVPRLKLTLVDNAKTAVADSDIVVTAGPIHKNPVPTIEKEWFKEGCLGLPVDFDSYWHPAAMRLADKFYVDDTRQFEYYKTVGYFKDVPKVLGDLGELVTGQVPARERDDERIIAMNLGLALDDMATAVNIYKLALAKGIGTVLPL
ncbi:MAG: ornithine cyclodeaminase family protein [Bacillota bacterium]